jgi:RNA polymerase sigma factor (sigma-70 family)
VEASALPASAGLKRARLGLGAPLLRLRPDEQLVSLFRAGNEDAFRVIHDRYRARMLAYARQMLASSSADAEDAVQEIFVRAYAGLRANRRDLALRAWLYRIAHNRCVDELRRTRPLAVEAVEDLREAPGPDPHARVEQREALRRLIVDVQHLPEQQRSALLMRELGGMPYADLAGALGVSVPAVKSLLVRARVGLAQADEARDTACASICEDLVVAHDRGVRASGRARRHMRDCTDCRRFRTEVQGMSRNLGLLIPALGPLAVAAKLIGLGGIGGGGSAAAGSGTGAAAAATATAAGATGTATAGGTAIAGATAGASAVAGATGTAAVTGTTAAAAGGTVAATASAGAAISAGASTGAMATAGAAAGTAHVATLLAATAIAAGGAISIQHAVSTAHPQLRTHHAIALAAVPRTGTAPAGGAPTAPTRAPVRTAAPVPASAATASGAAEPSRIPTPNATPTAALPAKATTATTATASGSPAASRSSSGVTALASNTGVPATSPSATATATTPATTDPTSTTPIATTPAAPPVTVAGPPSADPTVTDPASADPTSTVSATPPADPTTPAATTSTATPLAGATTGGDPVASSPPVTTTGRHGANPGTATGIVPTVSSATTWAGTGRSWRRIRLQTWRNAPRGVASGGTTAQR